MNLNNKEQEQVQHEQNMISFLDILVEFSKNLGLIIKIIIIFFIIGLAVVFFKPSTFTATSKVVAEMDNAGSMRFSSGLSALKSFGLNLGSAGSGLIAESYPDLIKSREVLYQVTQKEFFFKSLDSTMKFVDFSTHKTVGNYIEDYTYKLPFTIVDFFRPGVKLKKITESDGSILSLNGTEQEAIALLQSDYMSTSIDDETGIIKITTHANDRYLAAYINDAVLKSFQNHVQNIYNQKNSENLNFIKTQLDIAEQDLRTAEEKVVTFLKRNTNPQTIQLQTRLERLKSDVTFKAELFNELQLQYAQTKIELKKKEPVIRIIERPSPPLFPSGLGKLTILILFLFIGFLIGLIVVFYNFIIQYIRDEEENKEKMDFIKTSFTRYFSINRNKSIENPQ